MFDLFFTKTEANFTKKPGTVKDFDCGYSLYFQWSAKSALRCASRFCKQKMLTNRLNSTSFMYFFIKINLLTFIVNVLASCTKMLT